MPSKGASEKTKYAPIRTERMEWLLKAACRGVPMKDGISIFFPLIKKSPGRPVKIKNHLDAPLTQFYAEAIALCARCPVIDECRTEFTREPIPRDGMYFGKTPSQRARLQIAIRAKMIEQIRQVVPYCLDYIEDKTTEEAKMINEIHNILYGEGIPGFSGTVSRTE